MPASFTDLIELILDGQNVDAATINRVLRSLEGNSRYLKDVFDTALLSQAVFSREVTCESGLLVGMAAYFSPDTQQFERALAGTYVDESGLQRITEASYPWGVVVFKHNSTKCDLLLLGVSTIDLSAALFPGDLDGSDALPGVYYLSAVTAGKMSRSPAPTSVPVLQVGPNNLVFVRPNLADVFTRHVHYRESLVCLPAGTAAFGSGRWTIPSPNSLDEGWLPANHASFGGNAPAGAVFGYNMAQSPLGAIWPPLPLSGVHIEFDRGLDADVGGTAVPLGVDGLAIVDANGIWWMSNCEFDVPWPDEINDATTTTSTTNAPECPRALQMRMTVYFTKPVFQTTDTVVTSLVTQSPYVEIVCATDGSAASTGPLLINVDLALAVTAMDQAGHLVLKTLSPNGNLFAGPVVESVISATPSTLAITSDVADLAGGKKVANLTFSVQPSPLGGELAIVEVKMIGATLEYYRDIMSIGLIDDRTSSFRGEFMVPKALVGSTVTVRLRFWLLGRSTGTLPDLSLTARVLTQPGTAPAAVALPTSDSAVDIDTSHAIVQDTYIEVESDDIEASPGALIEFSLGRAAASGDGYDGDILVLKKLAIITNIA